MSVSALVEANGLYLEPVLHAIAEQLPKLWERAKDSGELHLVSISYSSAVQDRSNTYTPLSLFAVPIHSCLLSGKKSFPE